MRSATSPTSATPWSATISHWRRHAGDVYNWPPQGYKIREMLDILLSFSTVKIETRPDPKRMRPSDVELLLAMRPSSARKRLEPKYKFEQTMKDLLDYWRSH